MDQSPTLNLDDLSSNLAVAGFNLCRSFTADYLADSMPDLHLPAGCRHLLLIGNYGNALWQTMPEDYLKREHPVDSYTSESLGRLLDPLVPGCWSMLFPQLSDLLNDDLHPVPLQKLGVLAGWHHPSPLGIGINQQTGLWFAYRAVVAITVELDQAGPLIKRTDESPCLSCADTLCVSACPGSAVTVGESPDLQACVGYRVAAESSCATTCRAREACPVASQHRYTDDQLAYFYQRSLSSLKRWVSGT